MIKCAKKFSNSLDFPERKSVHFLLRGGRREEKEEKNDVKRRVTSKTTIIRFPSRRILQSFIVPTKNRFAGDWFYRFAVIFLVDRICLFVYDRGADCSSLENAPARP